VRRDAAHAPGPDLRPGRRHRWLPLHAYQHVLDRFGKDLDADENTLWVYDLRTNLHFTLKQSPIRRVDFDEFVACYKPGRLHERTATWSADNPDGRWRSYDYEELLKRDKLSLDLFWIKDKSLTDTDSLPAPDVLAAEIADDLEAALEQFNKIAARLGAKA
jgi:type I restriction enzyme M protein